MDATDEQLILEKIKQYKWLLGMSRAQRRQLGIRATVKQIENVIWQCEEQVWHRDQERKA